MKRETGENPEQSRCRNLYERNFFSLPLRKREGLKLQSKPEDLQNTALLIPCVDEI